MKRLLQTFLLLALTVSAFAVPAKKGVWRDITLSNGTTVRAQLVGDEFSHYWLGADGKKYLAVGDGFVSASDATLKANAARRVRRTTPRRAMGPRKSMDLTNYRGKKKGLIILVQFSDVSFKAGNDKAKFNDIANASGYTTDEGFRGSVKDYFIAQSDSLFELDFDVVGPVTLTHTRSYYGGNDFYGNDKHPGEMVADACRAVADSVNFADYDWNNDRYVDQVFVLYAGKGEADSQIASTIWPHEWTLYDSDYGRSLTLDNVFINTYACANELQTNGNISGIGTVCHEFSHCLGFPDLYDTAYQGYFGMGSWDLMCGGSYNGDGFCPAGYTSYEKMAAGWLNPIELDADTTVASLKPLSEKGNNAYIIYNKGNRNEFYLLENRQQKGWDTSLPASGLLVLHVDYDSLCWENNAVNTLATYSTADGYTANFTNDHERCTIMHADNDDDQSYWDSYQQAYWQTTEEGDAYPYQGNDSLTNNSAPAAIVYNANTDGSKYMNKAVTQIRQLDNGDISFQFGPSVKDTTTVQPGGDYLFYESFDKCDGKGGNDNLWSGNMASGTFSPDNDGWSIENAYYAYGANKCARFGSSKSTAGRVTTPEFEVNGSADFTFEAGAWNYSSPNDADLEISVDNGFKIADMSSTTIALKKGEWTTYQFKLVGTGKVKVTFFGSHRYFLDEVMAKAPKTTGISSLKVRQSLSGRIYNLQGQFVGTDSQKLTPGLYIRDGKKFIVR